MDSKLKTTEKLKKIRSYRTCVFLDATPIVSRLKDETELKFAVKLQLHRSGIFVAKYLRSKKRGIALTSLNRTIQIEILYHIRFQIFQGTTNTLL